MSEAVLQEVKPGAFIFEIRDALPISLCEEIVQRFEAKKDQQQAGRLGQQGAIDVLVKKTTDIPVSGNPDWADIDKALFASMGRAIRLFRDRYAFFSGAFKDTGYHLQRYLPGEFYQWHIDGGSHDFSYRQLVALWYLNDVPGPGGETEFLHQGVKITPEQGKLVLFPPFWTHEHRAVELQQDVKYIATTWLSFA